MRTSFCVAAFVVAALAVTGCGSGPETNSVAGATKEIASQKAGDLTISLTGETGELKQGQNRFTIAFQRNNQPVDPGTVTLGSSMSMPGMAPMVASIELQSAGETGKYSATGDFGMSGAWKFEVRWDGPAGQGTTSFSTNVR